VAYPETFRANFEATITPNERVVREAIARDWIKLRDVTNKLVTAENEPDADVTELALMRPRAEPGLRQLPGEVGNPEQAARPAAQRESALPRRRS
jgi:hypothetical protein